LKGFEFQNVSAFSRWEHAKIVLKVQNCIETPENPCHSACRNEQGKGTKAYT
jgi:hypothetical protein